MVGSTRAASVTDCWLILSAVERVVPKNPRERVKGVVYVERRCDRLARAGGLNEFTLPDPP